MEITNNQKVEKLDYYVTETLNNLDKWTYPDVDIKPDDTNIFLGSGSAACVAQLFTYKLGGLALNASDYKGYFQRSIKKDFATVNIISASGGKDTIAMAEFLNEMGIKPNLITCNDDAPAKLLVNKSFVFPSFIEPPTYNTSTYASMIYWLFNENLDEIKKTISQLQVPNLRKYKYIFFLAADKYAIIGDMAERKAAEVLEGIGANSDGFTHGSHGMLRQPNPDRLIFLMNQLYPLPDNTYLLTINSFLGLMLTTYYIIGKNQTDKDTQNLLKNYGDTVKAMGWKLNKVF